MNPKSESSSYVQQNTTRRALMGRFAKRTGLLSLTALIVVLGLVSAAAASAVWGG